MLKKNNQSLTGLGNAGLGGSEENVTLGPPSLSLLAVRPRYIIALLLFLRITIMWYFLFKITGFPWKNCKSVNPKFTLNIWDFLEGKTGRDTSGVGLLFRCWHVTDQHIGHRCLMWATQYREQCYCSIFMACSHCSKLHSHSRDPVSETATAPGRRDMSKVSISSSQANLCQANNW